MGCGGWSAVAQEIKRPAEAAVLDKRAARRAKDLADIQALREPGSPR